MNNQNVDFRNVRVADQIFEIVIFKKVDEPLKTFLKVIKDKKLFPLKVLGGQLSYITFPVYDEIEQDLAHENLSSPFEELFREAERMIEATVNG